MSAARVRAVRAALALAALLPILACHEAHEAAPAWSRQREALVRSIEERGVRDSATLAALRRVPRHEFVPIAHRERAYDDRPLPSGHGQTISQPYIVAFMTAAIAPRPGIQVLEVGTGSGYQAAVLAATGAKVYTIEILEPLANEARERLGRLGHRDIEVRHGDGYRGWPEAAPFDAILLTAAPDEIPAALIEQLAPGGRLVAPVGAEHEVQRMTLIEKGASGETTRTDLFPVRFVPMRKGDR